MKMKRCILHIGCEKTGTTSIQGALYKNIPALKRQGYFMFHTLGVTNNRTFPAYFEPFIHAGGGFNEWQHANGCLTPRDKEDFFEGFPANFHEEIEEAATFMHTTIITSEHFHSRIKTKKEMRRIHDFLSRSFNKIEIVCYFREPVESAIAGYSTVIKIGWNSNLDGFLQQNCKPDNYYYDHKKIADSWSEVFGIENCHFHLYNSQVDAFEHFSSVVGIKNATNRGADAGNRSLTNLQAQALRIINKKVPFVSGGNISRSMKNRKARAVVLRSELYNYGTIKSSLEPEIRETFREPTRLFFKKYFPEAKGYPRKISKVPEPTAEQYTLAYEHFLKTFLFTKIMDSVEKVNVNLIRDVAYAIRDTHPSEARRLLKHGLEFRSGAKVLEKVLSEWIIEDRANMMEEREEEEKMNNKYIIEPSDGSD